MKLLQEFGDRVRELRSKKGWSQEQFAAECGLHRTYVGSIERGERNVSLVNIERLAVTLGVSMGDLLAGVGRSPRSRKRSG